MTFVAILLSLPFILALFLFESYLWLWSHQTGISSISSRRSTSRQYRIVYQTVTLLQLLSLAATLYSNAISEHPLAIKDETDNLKCSGGIGQALRFSFQYLLSALSLWQTMKIIHVSLCINDYLVETKHRKRTRRCTSATPSNAAMVKRHRHHWLRVVFIVLITILGGYTIFISTISMSVACESHLEMTPPYYIVHYATLVYLMLDGISYAVALYWLRILQQDATGPASVRTVSLEPPGPIPLVLPLKKPNIVASTKDRLFTIDFEIDKCGYAPKSTQPDWTLDMTALSASMWSALPESVNDDEGEEPYQRLGRLASTQVYQLFVTLFMLLLGITRYATPSTITAFAVLSSFYFVTLHVGYALRRIPLLIAYARYQCILTNRYGAPT
ncbi:hypothetical protein BDF22DRAFT_665102 [Syncephalis plumigaleata]|nr:hypothetical protein BDF22DRAFT_665102 [Syncephalis plumigaleata]